MAEYIPIANLIVSVLIIPVLGYVVRLERRITKIETIIDMMLKHFYKERGDKR